jgi:hypothetical protein
MTRLINAKLTEEIIQLAVSYCQDGQHPDDLEKDLRNLITNAQTIEAEMFPSEGLQKALENYKKPSPLPVCKLTHEQLNTPYGVEPIKQTIEPDSGEAICYVSKKVLQSVLDKNAGLVPIWYEKDTVATEALFTSPPKREWVDLTDEQITKLKYQSVNTNGDVSIKEFAKEINDALKEVNGFNK